MLDRTHESCVPSRTDFLNSDLVQKDQQRLGLNEQPVWRRFVKHDLLVSVLQLRRFQLHGVAPLPSDGTLSDGQVRVRQVSQEQGGQVLRGVW